ncbi:hypothetical protein BDD12DRAFT_139382 [Trichophaea hybrida]|nr:hypothetical protein BDD12DRAFT_139382 [Trichophaea hybrida]
MDGLSVIAVIQVSGQIFNLCRDYYFAVKDARDDIQLLLDELTALQDVLESVAEMIEISDTSKLSILEILSKPNGPLEQCLAELNALETKLNSDARDTGERMRRFGRRALKWPFTCKDVEKSVGIIGRHKATFSLALTADQM